MTDYETLYNDIFKVLHNKKSRDRSASDMMALLINWHKEDPRTVVQKVKPVREEYRIKLRKYAERRNYEEAEVYRQLLFKSYLLTAPDDFDDYLQALEFDRPANERFYIPRRKVLKRVVVALQDLADDKLDELFLSMPPRVGKSTILMMYETWLIGRNSELHNLYSSYSDIITSAFYNGVLEVITDDTTYHWHDIYPKAKIVNTKADDETIDVDRKKRYKSLTCRSLYGTLNGACDADGTLIADDLIGSIEEAMSHDRLINAWSKVDNNLLPRAKEGCKILWCGTRWSMIDPMGLREDLLTNDNQFADRRYKIIDLPALDDRDESNFDYLYGVGFSTEYYKQRRASFERNGDMASWLAQYMCTPIEREGAVFDAGEMRYYNGVLPEEAPDRVFMAVDPAWGGGDFTASPVCVQYGDDIYVPGVAYTDAEKTFSQPRLAQVAERFHVGSMQIEANKMTEDFKTGVENALEKYPDYHCTVTTRSAPNNKAKEQRIFDKAPDIRQHFIFLEDGKRDSEYAKFMQNVFSFKITGKNKHDDAPDSLAQAADMAFGYQNMGKVEIFRRLF